jgi:hypothetical protein
MKNKITERKCKECETIISYVPRKIRCLDCHQKHINNAMFSTKKDDDITKEQKLEILKKSIQNLQILNAQTLLDKIFKSK